MVNFSISTIKCYSLDLILEEVGHGDDPVNIPCHVRVQARVAAASEDIITDVTILHHHHDLYSPLAGADDAHQGVLVLV